MNKVKSDFLIGGIVLRSVLFFLGCIGICNIAVVKVNPGGTATVNRLFWKGLENPIGVSGSLVFGWQIDSDAKNYIQSAYEIELSVNPDFRDKMVWRSGKIKSDNSISVKYTGEALTAATRYYWRVKVWGANGESIGLSHASSAGGRCVACGGTHRDAIR